MKKFILQIIGSALIVYYALPYFVADITVTAGRSAIIAALAFAFINFAIKPVVRVITLPLNIISLGLFGLVVNILLFWFVSSIVDGFTVANFVAAFWGALIMTVGTWILDKISD